MSDSEQDIIERVLAGDLEEYRHLVTAYEEDVFRMVAPVVGNRSIAEDITQEVFITAYRLLDRLHSGEPFRPWLMGIARNTLRNDLRKRGRERARMKHYRHYVDTICQEAPQSNREELSEALSRCLEMLTGIAAQAVEKYYLQGLDLSQTAGELGKTLTATRQLLYRIRISLRECVENRLVSMRSEG